MDERLDPQALPLPAWKDLFQILPCKIEQIVESLTILKAGKLTVTQVSAVE